LAQTKAAQRILAEAIAGDLGPQGVDSYVLIDAVIDLEGRGNVGQINRAIASSSGAPAEEIWHVVHQNRTACVVQR